MKIDVKERKYHVNWNSTELDGRESAYLILNPLRIYSKSAQSSRPHSFPVFRTKGNGYQEYNPVPDGMYEYYLSDHRDSESSLTKKKHIFLGEKRPLQVQIDRSGPSGSVQLTLCAPLPLTAGECGLDFGLTNPVPLPGTRQEGDIYTIRCLLLNFRPELRVRLWYDSDLEKILQTEAVCLNDHID